MTKAREIAELGQKLTVDASGNLDIAGTVEANNIQVEGASGGLINLYRSSANASFDAITFKDTTNTNINAKIGWNANELRLEGTNIIRLVSGGNASAIFGSNGDLSLYKNDGSTVGFTFDASTGKVGINNSNPAYGTLHIFDDNTDRNMDANGGGQLHIDGNGYAFGIALNTSGANIYTNSASRDLIFGTNETERVRIDGSGRVGIGNAIPGSFYSDANDLVVGSASGSNGMTIYTSTTGVGAIYFADGTTGSDEYRGGIAYAHDASDPNENLALVSGGETKMRIRTTGYAELASASQIRLTLGNAGTAGTNTANWIRGTAGALGLNAASDNIHFEIGGTERMRIDSNGNVGISNTPESDYHSGYKNLQIGDASAIMGNDSGSEETFILNNAKWASDASWEYIKDGTAAVLGFDQTIPMRLRYVAAGTADTDITWSEAFRIDSSGNLLVGTTNADVGGSVTGIKLAPNGSILASTDETDNIGNAPFYGDRRGTNNTGDVLGLALGGYFKSSIGVLGTSSSSSNGGITFNVIANNVTKSEKVRIDDDGLKFNGDTAAANALDDYEEGTWTPTLLGATTNPTVTWTTQIGKYRRVGNLLWVSFYLYSTNISGGSGTVLIGGWPFSIPPTTSSAYQFLPMGYAGNVNNADSFYSLQTRNYANPRWQFNNNSYATVYGANSNTWGSNMELHGTGTLMLA